MQQEKVCVVGMGYVGLTLALILSEVGFDVVGVDQREKSIKALRVGTSHFFEHGLEDILKRELDRHFWFHTEIADASASVYIVAVGTPVVGRDPKLEDLRNAAAAIGRVIKRGDVVILRSTVPVGATRSFVLPILEERSGLRGGADFYLAFAPERTVEGRALTELRTLPQVIGGLTPACTSRASDVFRTFAPQVISVDSLEAAEFVKVVNNTYRDVTFAFANEIAQLCHHWNLDAHRVIQAANSGYSRSHIPAPSPGVGGYCLTKDPYLLAYAARATGYLPKLALTARDVNESMPRHVADIVMSFFAARGKSLPGRKVLLMGIAFKGKPETSDIRFSPALAVAGLLREKGCRIFGHDPLIPAMAMSEEEIAPADPALGFANADVVIVMNNNPRFEQLPVRDLLETTAKPSLFFDAWRLFTPEVALAVPGVDYATLGYSSFLPKNKTGIMQYGAPAIPSSLLHAS